MPCTQLRLPIRASVYLSPVCLYQLKCFPGDQYHLSWGHFILSVDLLYAKPQPTLIRFRHKIKLYMAYGVASNMYMHASELQITTETIVNCPVRSEQRRSCFWNVPQVLQSGASVFKITCCCYGLEDKVLSDTNVIQERQIMG